MAALTHFNFLAARVRRRPGIAGVAIDRNVCLPFAALTLIALAMLALCVVQSARLVALRRAQVAAGHTLTLARERNADLEAMRSTAQADEARLAELQALRRDGLAQAAALATIGNRLPLGVRLRSIRFENGAYVLEGSATALTTVGSTIDALDRALAPAAAHLDSVHRVDGRLVFRLTLGGSS